MSCRSWPGLRTRFVVIPALAVVLLAGCAPADPQAQLEQAVAQMQDGLPMEVEEGLLLDAVTAGDMRIEYEYSFTSPMPGLDTSLFQAEIEKTLQKDMCAKKEMEVFWKNGISAVFIYKSNEGPTIGRVLIAPHSCGF